MVGIGRETMMKRHPVHAGKNTFSRAHHHMESRGFQHAVHMSVIETVTCTAQVHGQGE